MNTKKNKHGKLYLVIMLALTVWGTAPLALHGNVKLPRVVGSNMVLQRDAPLTIWGWADPGEKVVIAFAGKTLSVRADREGNWKTVFPPMKAGGPFTMVIRAKNTIQLDNIMVGEVWICSGQSNMEWIVANSNNSQEEIKRADYPDIRLFDVPNRISFKPESDVSGGTWKICSPETVANFSAIGYFFGRNLYQDLHVPIGLISSEWGGTLIESWTSEDALGTVPAMKTRLDALRSIDVKNLEEEQRQKSDRIRNMITGTMDGIVDGTAVWAQADYDDAAWPFMKVPGLWENTLLPSLDGVVWFRREVEIPESLIGGDVTLSLGKIDDSDMTWINGILIGKTTNKYNQDRNYPVPSAMLKPGKIVITVRIEDTGGGGGFWGEDEALSLNGTKGSVSLAGNWKFRISPVNYSFNDAIAGPNDYPSILYNGMIHPLLNYSVKGAIWYQGESNADAAFLYRTLHPLMIDNWREKWNNPDLVFLLVQLANYMKPVPQPANSEWAELREAQVMTLATPLTGMAVAIDIGDADDIHPRNKQDVGYRLSLAARKIAYHEDIVHSGPVYKSCTINGNRIELEFDHTGSGLMAKDKYGYLKGFAIAGADQQFKWAKAFIEGGKVIVYADAVPAPVAVRYAWADNPDDANLYNKEGLPASPFRTDTWKGITEK